MANILIKYDDYDLTEVVSDFQAADPSRLNIQAVPNRHGGIIQDGVVKDVGQLAFTGEVNSSSAAGLRGIMDNLGQVFNRLNKKFRLWDDRYINVYKAQFNWKFKTGTAMRAAVFSLQLSCPDPFWYADSPQNSLQHLTSGDTLVTGAIYRKTFTLVNSGNYIIYPSIDVQSLNAGGIHSITVRNITKNKQWTYSGTVANTTHLVVDANSFLVTNNLIEDLTNWVGDWVGLDPGSNTMQIEGEVPADYTFNYAERWNTP